MESITARPPSGASLTASVPYLRGDLKRLHVEFTEREKVAEELEPQRLEIRSGRTRGCEPSLGHEGFQLVHHPCPVVKQHLDELLEHGTPPAGSPLQQAYNDQTIPLIRELSGAREVFPALGFVMRYSSALGRAGEMTPAVWAHFDYDADETRVQLDEALASLPTKPAPFSRHVLFQGWRAITPPPQDLPLAMCDGRTVRMGDVVPIDYHQVRNGRDVTYKSSGARFSPEHRWWYYPDMTADEMLVFKGFDSALGDAFKTLHVAIEDTSRPGTVPRVSIESRYFALYD
jgi:hypothetical protein